MRRAKEECIDRQRRIERCVKTHPTTRCACVGCDSTHRLFSVTPEGDVQIDLPVAPWETALGARVNVPTLDGSVEMTIPAGAQGGQRLRLRGQGLNRRGGGRGDEYVRLKIVTPPKPTEEERELFERLAAESRFDPRELLRL